MAKRKSANPFQGRWLIEHMGQWDVAEESEELQPCPNSVRHEICWG